ncbi:MAG: hypothetical protein SNJ84_02175 [Verrucomicrobiia bacterium]
MDIVVYNGRREIIQAKAIRTAAVDQLVAAVNACKVWKANRKGGAFLINEFGQVLCPYHGGSEKYYVGKIEHGSMPIQFAMNNLRFDLGANELTTGNAWHKPYLGSMFSCTRHGDILRVIADGRNGVIVGKPCPHPDKNLIRRLLKVRPKGCRFIVNDRGVVLTKSQVAPKDWQPIFVGVIDHSRWWPEEAPELRVPDAELSHDDLDPPF